MATKMATKTSTTFLKITKERQLQELLMNETNTSTVSDALKRAKKQWQK